MQEWWNTLTGFQQTLYVIALPFTLILVLQTIMSLIGVNFGGDADFDMDADGDMDFDTDGDSDGMLGFKFFSLRGIVAFFTIFGWVGLVLSNSDISQGIVIFIALVSGLIAMFVVGWLFTVTAKLQDSGNIDYNNAIGKTAEVYMTIPRTRKGSGKIQITVQERLREMEALTDEEKDLKTGTLVEVVEVINSSVAVVKRLV